MTNRYGRRESKRQLWCLQEGLMSHCIPRSSFGSVWRMEPSGDGALVRKHQETCPSIQCQHVPHELYTRRRTDGVSRPLAHPLKS